MDHPLRFRDKVAFVTGGGTGLGLEVSRRLCREGAAVVCASRDPAHHETLLREAEAEGWRVLSRVLDVREPRAVRGCVQEVAEELGGLHVLVNNAAGNFIRPALKLAPKAWQAVIDIALSGVFYCSQAAGRVMVPQGEGVIVNVGAPYADSGMPGVIHSACAKAGVHAMTKSLAAEWGPSGVRVCAVSPGPFQSEGASARLWPSEEIEEKVLSAIPAGRFGRAGEVADAILWLASSEAAYCNGTILTIDGGWRLPDGFALRKVQRRRD